MGRAVGLAAMLFAGLLLVKACSPFGGASAFTCDSDDDCQTQGVADGRCEPTGFCSFPDEQRCGPGGRAYGELSGGGLAGTCVGDEPGGVDAPDDQVCLGAEDGLARPCFATAPTGAVVLTTTIDTDGSPQCSTAVSNISACVIAGQTITINAGVTITASGTRPLVLAATESVTIDGTLDLASHRINDRAAAGANDPTCAPGTAAGASGGGAGGSFGALGGTGGFATAGIAGAAPATPTTLRGGCKGQDGLEGTGALGTRGLGGNGGGALYIIAGTTLTIGAQGQINASGAGGTNGINGGAGGGGGGSGGLIGLDAPSVTNGGSIFANGGGGGEGSGSVTIGNPGADPVGVGAAPGGANGTINGGDGGAGGAATAAGTGATAGASGGGGGGSVGVIRVFPAQTLGGEISPPPT